MKKILSLLVCFAMLFTFVSVLPASAETTLTQDSDGYYLIGTADDYLAFVELANADLTTAINGKLIADINLAGKDVKTIGKIGKNQSASTPYKGTFDGNKHVIRNMTISEPIGKADDKKGLAMFACLDTTAVVKDLGIENALIVPTYSQFGNIKVSVITAACYDATISNCYVKNSTVKITAGQKAQCVGIFAGIAANSSTIENCYSIGNTIEYTEDSDLSVGTTNGVSGFVGYRGSKAGTKATIIKNCYAKDNTIKNVSDDVKAGICAPSTDSTPITEIAENTYVDQKFTKDANVTVVTVYASDAAEWATLADTLGPAYKNDVNGGAPRLAWEEDPEQVTEYTVTIAEGIVGGSVEASVAKAAAGEEVTLTVNSEFNYEVDVVKVNGTVINENDGIYSFEMPEEDVTVTATFKQILEKVDGYYLINDADDYLAFVKLANKDLTINGKLTADIDLAGKTVTVIGTDTALYSGTFDGNGYVIKNLTISQTHKNDSTKFVGMFSKTNNAVIKNLGLENASIIQPGGWNKSSTLVGGFAGQLSGTTSLENCYVKNSSILNANESDCAASGIGALTGSVGSNATVKNCYVIGTTVGYVEGSSYPAGGIAVGPICGYVGKNGTSNTIQNCYAANNTVQASAGRKTSFCRFGTDEESSNKKMIFANCYTDIHNDDSNWDTATVLTDVELRAASLLGEAFKTDFYAVNGGFPMLTWEDTTGLAKDIDFVYAGLVKADDAITAIKLEKADATALAGKLYAAVFSGDVLQYAKIANVSENTAGAKTITLSESITLAEGEELRIFVWDNNLNPLMYAVK